MWTLCITVFTISWPIIESAEYDVLYSNGWIPLSRDKLYDQLKQSHMSAPVYTSTYNYVYPNEEKEDKVTDDDLRKPNDDEESECVKNKNNCVENNIVTPPDMQMANNFVPIVYEVPSNKQNENNIRKSKYLKQLEYDTDQKTQDTVWSTKINEKHKNIMYEVTESVESEDVLDKEESEKGYIYKSPPKQNSSNILFDILSNYNIRINDDLPNYVLSRKQSQNLNKNKPLLQPFPIRIGPNRYNSLNHLPIDPLLAVFLSNYGYYAQGLYGIRNNYKNLYGYLASNNIHNNRPFGFYKVFSDTDSSH